MVCSMNKFKITQAFMIIAIIVFFITNAPAMAGTVDTLIAQYDVGTGMLNISGSATLIEKNVITVEVFSPNGNLLYFATATLAENGTFSNRVKLGTLGQGTYLVRSADYVGGTYKTATFIITSINTELPPDVVIVDPPKTEVVNELKKAVVTVKVDTSDSGVLTGTVTQSDILNIQSSTTSKIEILMDQNSDANKSIAVFEKEALNALSKIEFSKVVFDMPVATLSLDQSFFDALPLGGDKELSISAEKINPQNLTDEMQKMIGEKPLFDFKVMYGEEIIKEFEKPITITIPYALKTDENPDNIIIYYLRDDGSVETMSNCFYNPATKSVTFSTYHFSYFLVGYTSVTFTDVSKSDSYYNAVNFIAARGITNGVGNGTFAPEKHLTRAQFIVMLFRAYGITPLESFGDNFSDAQDSYYTPYLAKAKVLGISNGAGNNKFLPDNKITIQEIYTLIYRTLNVTDQLPDTKNTSQMSIFSDAQDVDEWAKYPINVLLNRGVLNAKQSMLTPDRLAMRYDIAEILYRAFYGTYE